MLFRSIHFLGFSNDVPQLMMASDLSVSSSSQEGLPVYLLEALMAGLPIIATNSRGHADLVEEGVNGYIVDVADKSQFAEKTTELYKDVVLRNNLASSSTRRLDGYRISDIMSLMRDLYGE